MVRKNRSIWEVVRLPKSGEPTTALRSAVTILRTPSFFPRRDSVTSDILPLLIKLDSQTRKIAKFLVHVIRERLARLANDARNDVFLSAKDSRHRADWSPLAERCQNRRLFCFWKSSVVHIRILT